MQPRMERVAAHFCIIPRQRGARAGIGVQRLMAEHNYTLASILRCCQFCPEPVQLLSAHATAKLYEAALHARHAIGTVLLLWGDIATSLNWATV